MRSVTTRFVTTRSTWLVAGVTATALALTPGTASADKGGNSSQGGKVQSTGNQNGGTLESLITYSGGTTGGGSGKKSGFRPVGDWTPPACWYEPRTADQFAQSVEKTYDETVNYPGQHSYAKAAVGQYREKYKDGEYKNYNKDIADEGNWWVAVQDPDRWMEPEAQNCNKDPFWVENGDPPNVPNAVTPQVLAELAYSRTKVPATEVALAPENVTKVNLPTWAWLDKATFKEVSVTAQLNVGGLNIQATTTAKPLSLKLEPGTTDAETYPASGECAINADGSIGEPYAKGKAEQTPPCGLTYLRSSGEGTYKLQATVTWEITWTGTGGAGGNLPNGEFGNDQPVTVQEIQSVNR